MITVADKNIVETYSKLLSGLNTECKIKLIEVLSKSLSTEKKAKDEDFYKAFGAFASSKTAEEIIKHLRWARKFKQNKIEI